MFKTMQKFLSAFKKTNDEMKQVAQKICLDK